METAQLVEKNWQDYLKLLKTMMEIPSVKGTPEKDAPYGKEPKRALEKILEIGKKMGFQGKLVKNAVAYLQWGEDAKDYIGILGHLDVVPAGDGWHYPPFSLTEKDGYLYGRGVLDNKGPITSCLYALYLLKESGFQPKKTIRIIFGSDEESGMSEVPLYLKEEVPPIFGFTPDCKYPVVYGERGVVSLRLKRTFSKEELENLGTFAGDTGRDHVSDLLEVKVKDRLVTATGKRTPSNAPELGVSALTTLLGKLGIEKDLPESVRTYLNWLFDNFHNQHFGEGVNLALEDKDSGKLILTPVYLQKEGDSLLFDVSIRYPVSFSEQDVLTRLKGVLPEKTQIEILRSMPGIKKDNQDPRILKLGQIYEEITGLDGTPVTTTGGTYARKMPNIVAFGPSFPGQKGIAHNADEWMKVSDLKKNLEIYYTSIKALIRE